MQIIAGKRYRHRTTRSVLFVVRVESGRVSAWPDPVDVEFRVDEGKNVGHTGVTTIKSAQDWWEEV